MFPSLRSWLMRADVDPDADPDADVGADPDADADYHVGGHGEGGRMMIGKEDIWLGYLGYLLDVVQLFV